MQLRIDSPFFRCLAIAGICSALAAGLALAWQTPDFEYFVPNGDYVMEVDGQPAPQAEIWVSSKPVALLLRDPRLSQAIILRPGKTDVETMALEYLSANGMRLEVAKGHRTVKVGQFTVVAGSVSFRFDEHDVLLKLRPPLLGIHSSTDIHEFDAKWGERAEEYRPDAALIQKARSFAKPCKVIVYFGSWCPHCQAHVPFIMQVEDALKGSNIGFEYYGLPRRFGNDLQAQKYDIKLIPTAIVWVDGQEVGRIEEGDWDKPEAKLAQLLSP